MFYKLQLILALIGGLIVLAGLFACFLFGLLPALSAIDSSDTATLCALIWFAGFLLSLNGLRAVVRHDQRYHANAPQARPWDNI